MGKRIERAGGEIVKIMEQAIEEWHEELVAEKIIVAVLMVHPELDDDGLPKGPALKQNGLPVAGLAKIATPRERVLAGIDAVVLLDAHHFDIFTGAQELALFDHELTHFEIARDANGIKLTHDDGRTKLRFRKFDWSIGGFIEVIERQGVNALAVAAMQELKKQCQMLFEFMDTAKKAVERGKVRKRKTA